jgi:UDP-N-acetylglucosamine 1-carboxyvinyltransferase
LISFLISHFLFVVILHNSNPDMNAFEVQGGKQLGGEIIPQGAKNEALQIISAVLLTPEKITITNIPDILDVNLLIELLSEMDVKIERPQRDTCIFPG